MPPCPKLRCGLVVHGTFCTDRNEEPDTNESVVLLAPTNLERSSWALPRVIVIGSSETEEKSARGEAAVAAEVEVAWAAEVAQVATGQMFEKPLDEISHCRRSSWVRLAGTH
eukprot:Rhum_TRINITY_DN11333_c0_g1::Rhum_TRINITY_DN11333_c0_g1_i1::g.44033::m.44033